MEGKQIKEIAEGFTNLFKKGLNLEDPKVKEQAKVRYHHCLSCTIRVKNVCDPTKHGKHIETGKIVFGCGCLLAAKVRSPKSSCPLGKWDKMNLNKPKDGNTITTKPSTSR